MSQIHSDDLIARLKKHSKDCVEKQLLLDVAEQLQQMHNRIQHLVSDVNYLEHQLSIKGLT